MKNKVTIISLTVLVVLLSIFLIRGKFDTFNDDKYVDMLESKEMTLYTIKPGDRLESKITNEKYFKGYEIIEKKTITDKQQIQWLASSLINGMTSASISMNCYIPRHAFEYKGGYLIACFSCNNGEDQDGDVYFSSFTWFNVGDVFDELGFKYHPDLERKKISSEDMKVLRKFTKP